jgi:alkaline phosphatase D
MPKLINPSFSGSLYTPLTMKTPFHEPQKRDLLKALASGLVLSAPIVHHTALWAQTTQSAQAALDPQDPQTLFGLGVASGEPHPQGFTLWTRLYRAAGMTPLAPEIPVRYELATDPQFKSIVRRGQSLSEGRWGHSVHVDLTGLKPSTPYWYRFDALGQQSPIGKTRTTPARDSLETLNFVIASCQRFDQGHYAAWKHIAKEAPDMVLFLGDYIYEYGPIEGRVRMHEGARVTNLAQYRERYAQYKRDPALQAAHAVAPWMSIWDDHEVDDDYAGLQGADLQDNFQLQRNAAYQAYWENMPLPMSMRPRLVNGNLEISITRRVPWGQLAQLHFIDDRQFRDPQACPKPGKGGSNVVKRSECPALEDSKRTLLGVEQEAWLYRGWDLERPWNLLAQQTLMAPLSWGPTQAPDLGTYWTDGWDGYPLARARLLESIKSQGVKGLVTLGGDVHAHFVTDLRAHVDDPQSLTLATEFCGTSISSVGLDNALLQKIKLLNPHIQYARSDQRGYMSFTLSEKLLTARVMALVDVNDPNSLINTAATYEVDPKKPGAQLA